MFLTQFKKLELVVTDPRTLVIAMSATETEVVVRALDALDKFAQPCMCIMFFCRMRIMSCNLLVHEI